MAPLVDYLLPIARCSAIRAHVVAVYAIYVLKNGFDGQTYIFQDKLTWYVTSASEDASVSIVL